MATDFPFDEQLRFTAADDEMHAAGPERDWTETTWWSFAVPERAAVRRKRTMSPRDSSCAAGGSRSMIGRTGGERPPPSIVAPSSAARVASASPR